MELEEGVSFAEARRRERSFFEETAPWRSHSGLSERMGTPNLTKALSKLLGGVINSAYVPFSPLLHPFLTHAL